MNNNLLNLIANLTKGGTSRNKTVGYTNDDGIYINKVYIDKDEPDKMYERNMELPFKLNMDYSKHNPFSQLDFVTVVGRGRYGAHHIDIRYPNTQQNHITVEETLYNYIKTHF